MVVSRRGERMSAGARRRITVLQSNRTDGGKKTHRFFNPQSKKPTEQSPAGPLLSSIERRAADDSWRCAAVFSSAPPSERPVFQ